MDWLSLALLSAFSLAAADALTKRFFGDCRAWELLLVRFALPALMLLPWAWAHPLPAVPLSFWLWLAVLVPLELAAMLCYMLAIRDSPLYLTLPYLAFTPVFNILTGYAVLGETVTLRGCGGIALVVAGAYLLNLDRLRTGRPGAWFAPLRAIAHERGSRLMLVAAVIYSLTSALSKHVMLLATPASFGPFYFLIIGAAALLLTAVHRPRQLRVLGRRPAALLVTGVLMALMVVTHFLALARVEVAYFIAVKRSSLLFGIVMGALMFGERQAARHFVAGGLMVSGVALIAGS